MSWFLTWPNIVFATTFLKAFISVVSKICLVFEVSARVVWSYNWFINSCFSFLP
jgi:hypothetical protein